MHTMQRFASFLTMGPRLSESNVRLASSMRGKSWPDANAELDEADPAGRERRQLGVRAEDRNVLLGPPRRVGDERARGHVDRAAVDRDLHFAHRYAPTASRRRFTRHCLCVTWCSNSARK